tara:strand:+ start:1167 stop:1832 length:666 start_codon:yes stop_codon:yes gene_type:complete
MAESYKDFLRISNLNQGVDTTLRAVTSGDGDTTGLSLEDGTTGNVQVSGTLLTPSINSRSFTSYNQMSFSSAHNGDNSVIAEVCKIPALSIITRVIAVLITKSGDLSTYNLNLSLSTSTGTSADGALANASTTITVPEILGAGASNTYQQHSGIALAGTASDIDASSGGTEKKVHINYPSTTIVGTADTFLYVCNAGTGNGTTSSSANVVLDVIVEYIGVD